MHREPTPKAQAVILRQLFAEKGVELAHRQSLDVVARLHGHASWNVMSAQAPAAVEPAVAPPAAAEMPDVLAPVQSIPTRRTKLAADGPVKRYDFDAIAYVPTRKQMKKLDEVSYRVSPALWAAVEERALALGFTCVGCVGLEEDEGQEDDDIKIFVGVELYGRADLTENDSAPEELACLLSELCEPMLMNKKGELIAEPDDWEVLSVDELDNVPNKRKSYVFEGSGFVATRAQLKSLQMSAIVSPKLWADVQSKVVPFGFDLVGNIDLCEDDGGQDFNIPVSVCVRLHGRSYLSESSPVPGSVIQALETLSEPLTKLPDGSKAFGPVTWELSSIEPLPNPMMLYP